jgi:hypothetical protein
MVLQTFSKIQSNLSSAATLGTPKMWPLYIGDCSVEVFQSKLISKLAWPDFVWLLLTGCRYLEVAVNMGLTVITYFKGQVGYLYFLGEVCEYRANQLQ